MELQFKSDAAQAQPAANPVPAQQAAPAAAANSVRGSGSAAGGKPFAAQTQQARPRRPVNRPRIRSSRPVERPCAGAGHPSDVAAQAARRPRRSVPRSAELPRRRADRSAARRIRSWRRRSNPWRTPWWSRRPSRTSGDTRGPSAARPERYGVG